jgi:hypothetical protein
MELENNSYLYDLNDAERKICRTFMNSKIDIFQDTSGYVYRGKNINQKFANSYEHIKMQNDAACVLSSASNLLVFTLGKGLNSMNQSIFKLKKTFTQNEIEDKESSDSYVQSEYKKIKFRLMKKKLETDQEYKKLCEIIDSPVFDSLMRSNLSLLKAILNHKYFPYHPKYEEINEKYRKLLCPAMNQGTNSNTEEEEVEEEN